MKGAEDPLVCNFLWIYNYFKIKRFFILKDLKRKHFLTMCSGLCNVPHEIISCTVASQNLGNCSLNFCHFSQTHPKNL